MLSTTEKIFIKNFNKPNSSVEMEVSRNPVQTAAVAFAGPVFGLLVGYQIGLADNFTGHLLWQLLWSFIFFKLLVSFSENNFKHSVTIHSIVFGFLLSFGCQLVAFSWWQTHESYPLPFGLLLFVIVLYHFSEFMTIAFISPDTVAISDFLLKYDFDKDLPDGTVAQFRNWLCRKTYKGIEHHILVFVCLFEFFIETLYYPDVKFSHLYISYLGFAICMGAEMIRKMAIITAGRNFNHVVQEEQKANHVLVTEGLYSRWRHPSYVGQFYWTIGCQLILLNPVSTVLMTFIVWFFCNKRIVREEIKLVEFFGDDYIKYRKRVSSGIPGIK